MKLKFKIWDLKKNKWVNGRCFVNENGSIYSMSNGCNEIKYESMHLELVLFINQKDKNGFDIYSGDFLKIGHNSYTMYWNDDDIIEVKWDEDLIGWSPFCDDHSDYDGLRSRNVQIVGNKYENSELLGLGIIKK